ncbi:MAG: hypothetical protein ACRDKZ_12170 [Actinomycetota bacterium]
MARRTFAGSARGRRAVSSRVVTGLALLMFGKAFLFGALFAPLSIVLDDPGTVPMPERLVGFWIIGVGVLLLVPWPHKRGPGDEPDQ